MTIDQAIRTDLFQEIDARTPERKHLNEFLDDDRRAEKFEIV